METLKSCEIADQYKHVCFKDLENYIRKDQLASTLSGLCQIELDKIKNILGINSVYVDKVLREYSPNAIANGTVTAALRHKADINALSKVAFTGKHDDLEGSPCTLPNPDCLLIESGAGLQHYDGSEPVKIVIPVVPENLTETLQELQVAIENINDECINKIEHILVNNVEVPIDCKTVNITIPELPSFDQYALVGDVNTELDILRGKIEHIADYLGITV